MIKVTIPAQPWAQAARNHLLSATPIPPDFPIPAKVTKVRKVTKRWSFLVEEVREGGVKADKRWSRDAALGSSSLTLRNSVTFADSYDPRRE